MKSDPKDDSSPTFGELIKQGKLPGGEESPQLAFARRGSKTIDSSRPGTGPAVFISRRRDRDSTPC